LTAIEPNLSGSGNGTTWVVDTDQRVASEAMTATVAPPSVITPAQIEPVKDDDAGAIELPVATAPTGKFASSAVCMAVAAAEELVTSERFIDVEKV
jgi:hypothetical protein